MFHIIINEKKKDGVTISHSALFFLIGCSFFIQGICIKCNFFTLMFVVPTDLHALRISCYFSHHFVCEMTDLLSYVTLAHSAVYYIYEL